MTSDIYYIRANDPAKGTDPKENTHPRDPVFFPKHQLRVGTPLRFFGRTDRGALWIVTEIWTFTDKVSRRVNSPLTMMDIVQLRNQETGQIKTYNFTYLSYSAIWRIAE